MKEIVEKSAGICELHPVTAAGLAGLLRGSEFEVRFVARTLAEGIEAARRLRPGLFLLDKAFGLPDVLEGIRQVRESGLATAVLVWGATVTEAEALRLVQSGVRGIVRKSAPVEQVLHCVLAAAEGRVWVEHGIVPRAWPHNGNGATRMTARERQILALVSQGMRNREMAGQLGIRPGTVKVHLKHIFEKTGIHGRYSLALSHLGTPEEAR